MRQIGVGTPGGAEALAIFHQLLYDEWVAGSLNEPLARIKVGGTNCFRMIEWRAVRDAASQFLPEHTAAAAWKHRNLSHVDQEGLAPMPADRGAEQGDVDGPLECSLALGMVATGTQGTRGCSAGVRLDAMPVMWMVRDMARVSTATLGSITLGVAVGPRQFTADQLSAKADVIRAMHERVQL